MVSLPLVAEGRPIGLIDVFDTRVRDYTSTLDFIRGAGRLPRRCLRKGDAGGAPRERQPRPARAHRSRDGVRRGPSTWTQFLGTVAQRILEVSSSDLCDIYGLIEDEPDVEVLLSLGREELRDQVGRRYASPATSVPSREAAATGKPVTRLDVPRRPALERP